jgi:hypothetical protein
MAGQNVDHTRYIFAGKVPGPLAKDAVPSPAVFRSGHFADMSLSQWMGLTPQELVRAHLNLDRETMAALPKEKPIIV